MYKAVINDTTFNLELSNSGTQINETEFTLDSTSQGKNLFHIIRNNKSYTAAILDVNIDEKLVTVAVDRKKMVVQLKDDMDELLKSMGISSSVKKKVKEVKAPMPGLITKIIAKEGSTIQKGDGLLILEAMKMENILKSPVDGVIKEINCKAGTAIEKNEVLITFA